MATIGFFHPNPALQQTIIAVWCHQSCRECLWQLKHDKEQILTYFEKCIAFLLFFWREIVECGSGLVFFKKEA